MPGLRPNLLYVVPDDPDDELRSLAENLVGPAEIGRLLHVGANTINIWKMRHSDFPRPIRRLKSSDLWDVREIRAWAERTNRLPAGAADD
jgi:hypothetical protein